MADLERTFSIKTTSRMDLDKETTAEIIVTDFSKGSRMMRAMRAIGICWGAAVFAILVPIVHFFLVPFFLLLGIFMFFQQYGLRMSLVRGQVRCPSCNSDVPLKAGAFDWPKREICGNCRADLLIQP
jgi:hypothetical protein